ncbi:uncharacterized protein N7479_006656 [Penicillium vulpinum]|uniref:uncharacterized protein n=1 Tax=Penicillium vulpinum TaxID=29845 RepID=UPI002547BD92|nr:uncharacterized protein N7479_006656 [Penicillium vulpinum]KAJ5959506.1 hypothetical protein N7479_006656 [Penicillium vulpinum]
MTLVPFGFTYSTDKPYLWSAQVGLDRIIHPRRQATILPRKPIEPKVITVLEAVLHDRISSTKQGTNVLKSKF